MSGQIANSSTQDCDLNLCRTGISRMSPIFFNDLGLGLPIQTASAAGYRRSSVLFLPYFYSSIAERVENGRHEPVPAVQNRRKRMARGRRDRGGPVDPSLEMRQLRELR